MPFTCKIVVSCLFIGVSVNPRNLVIVALILVGVVSVASLMLPSGPGLTGVEGDFVGEERGEFSSG